MLWPVIGLRGNNQSDFETYYPWVYTNSGWVRCCPAVYNGGWHYMGDTLWLQWRDKNGKDMVDENSYTIQVRMKKPN